MAIFGVKIHTYGQSYFFSGDPGLKITDRVMVLEDDRLCLGEIVHGPYQQVEYLEEDDLPLILRQVNPSDLAEEAENLRLRQDAITFCRSCIQLRQLEMKLVDVEVFFDRTKIIFFFIAPTRIDFRELVKDLVRRYHTRIELRQIGVRHETQMIGAVGTCGRVCCCRQYLRKFSPVSIQMAKLQHIFLNSGKISGTCGRLLCCLAYEQETYDEFYAQSPRINKIYHTKLGDLKVVATNMYTSQVTTLADDGTERKFTLTAWADLNPTRVDGGRDDLDVDGSLEESLGLVNETGEVLESLSAKDASEERAPIDHSSTSSEAENLYYFPKNRGSAEKKPNYYQKMNPQIPLNLEERKGTQPTEPLSQTPKVKVVLPEAARVKEYLAGQTPILSQDLALALPKPKWIYKGGPLFDFIGKLPQERLAPPKPKPKPAPVRPAAPGQDFLHDPYRAGVDLTARRDNPAETLQGQYVDPRQTWSKRLPPGKNQHRPQEPNDQRPPAFAKQKNWPNQTEKINQNLPPRPNHPQPQGSTFVPLDLSAPSTKEHYPRPNQAPKNYRQPYQNQRKFEPQNQNFQRPDFERTDNRAPNFQRPNEGHKFQEHSQEPPRHPQNERGNQPLTKPQAKPGYPPKMARTNQLEGNPNFAPGYGQQSWPNPLPPNTHLPKQQFKPNPEEKRSVPPRPLNTPPQNIAEPPRDEFSDAQNTLNPNGAKTKHRDFLQMLDDDWQDLGLEDNGKPDYPRNKKGYPAKAMAKKPKTKSKPASQEPNGL